MVTRDLKAGDLLAVANPLAIAHFKAQNAGPNMWNGKPVRYCNNQTTFRSRTQLTELDTICCVLTAHKSMLIHPTHAAVMFWTP